MSEAIGYVRVSTGEQADEGVSLDAQEARIRAYCTTFGHECARVFTDSGLSGREMRSRPGLMAALDAVCAERGILVVYSLSRMSRSVRDTLDIAERLRNNGADLASITENLDTTTATGRMVFKLLAVFAEFERDLLSERTSAALQHKARKGERVGRYAQYGYRLLEDGSLVEDAAEQRVIEAVQVMAAHGHSPSAIAALLNAANKEARGRLWRTNNITKLLNRHRPLRTP